MNIQDIAGRTIAEVNDDPTSESCCDEIGIVFTDGSRIIIRAIDNAPPRHGGNATIDVGEWDSE